MPANEAVVRFLRELSTARSESPEFHTWYIYEIAKPPGQSFKDTNKDKNMKVEKLATYIVEG